MKNIIFVMLLASVVFCCGCMKNDNEPPKNDTLPQKNVDVESEADTVFAVAQNESAETDTAVDEVQTDVVADEAEEEVSEPQHIGVTGITLNTYDVTLDIGKKIMPLVTMTPSDAEDKSEIWTSSDENVATVNNMGSITGVAEGTCTVTVTSADNPEVSAVVKVTVLPKPQHIGVTGISLNTYDISVMVGAKTMPLVTMTPSDATDKGEIWTSSDENVATVNNMGSITGVAEGTCTVTVTSADNPEVSAVVKVTVLPKPQHIGVTGISLNTYDISVMIGAKTMPLVTMTPSDATDKGEIWTSSDSSVATVNNIGNITGVAEGTCTVTVTSTDNPEVSAVVNVTVLPRPQGPTTPVESECTYIDGILIANKTYPLPQSYAPGNNPEAYSALQVMFNDAKAEGLSMWVCSGYRSYDTQKALYNRYVARDGKAEADRYSARPGHSEHQTGLAFDINYADNRFKGTAEATWLANNCYKYGFIIRYPENKEHITGYKYEPWHVRYIGADKAKAVYESGLCLEEYLGITSVYTY